MTKISFRIFTLVLSSIYLLSPSISPLSPGVSPAYAQDAPNTNVTKRRPDRPAGYSPVPTSSSSTEPSKPEVKQVQTSQSSFFADLWARIKAFFGRLIQQPQASTTSATP